MNKPREEKKKDLIWKAGEQQIAVLAKVKGEVYEVCLTQEQRNSLIFILPQLYDDHKIKIIEKPLDIELEK